MGRIGEDFRPFYRLEKVSNIELVQSVSADETQPSRKTGRSQSGKPDERVLCFVCCFTAQFHGEEYSTGEVVLSFGGGDTFFGGGFGIGGMLKAVCPDWPEDEKYDVQWCDVYDRPDRFRKFDYDAMDNYEKENYKHVNQYE